MDIHASKLTTIEINALLDVLFFHIGADHRGKVMAHCPTAYAKLFPGPGVALSVVAQVARAVEAPLPMAPVDVALSVAASALVDEWDGTTHGGMVHVSHDAVVDLARAMRRPDPSLPVSGLSVMHSCSCGTASDNPTACPECSRPRDTYTTDEGTVVVQSGGNTAVQTRRS